MSEFKKYWLDKLSLDENGWMDAIPVQETDEAEYKNHIKVIEYSAYQQVKENLQKAIAALEFCVDNTEVGQVAADTLKKIKDKT